MKSCWKSKLERLFSHYDTLFAGSLFKVLIDFCLLSCCCFPSCLSKPIRGLEDDYFSVIYVLNIFIVRYIGSNHKNLYYNAAAKVLVATTITCVVAVTLALITFPSSIGIIQDIFAQITPVSSTGNNSGNLTNGSSNVDQPSTLTSNTTNSSSIIQLATLSSYQPITPSSYNGGSTSNDDDEGSSDNDEDSNDSNDDENQDTNYSDDDDEDSSEYNDDNNDDNDYGNDNGNIVVVTSSGNLNNEDDDDDDDDNNDYGESDETENDGYYYGNNHIGISIGSGGAFASAGGGGAFASAGGGGAFASAR